MHRRVGGGWVERKYSLWTNIEHIYTADSIYNKWCHVATVFLSGKRHVHWHTRQDQVFIWTWPQHNAKEIVYEKVSEIFQILP